MTDFKGQEQKNAAQLTTVSSHFFKNFLLLAILSFIALLKSYHIEWKFFADHVLVENCIIINQQQQGGKVIFFL
jgi:hypothetical protein